MRNIRKDLLTQADSSYAEFHRKICPNAGEVIGVRLPALRKLAREIVREDWRAFLSEPAEYYEEILLQGLVIGYAKCPLAERMDLIAGFVPGIQNWAVCDSFCTSLKSAEKESETFWTFLQPYLAAEQEFSVRFGVVMLLDYYVRKPEWCMKVVEKVLALTHEGYYVKMAVAWTLAEAVIHFPQVVPEYLTAHFPEPETCKMMVRKLLDSRRVSDADKEMWRKMAAR